MDEKFQISNPADIAEMLMAVAMYIYMEFKKEILWWVLSKVLKNIFVLYF